MLTAVSDGGSMPFVVAVPTGKKLTVRVTGTRKASSVVATGYVSRLGDQALAFAPLPGTRILGAGDVLAEHPDATIDLAGSTNPVTSGNVVMARPRDAAPYVARVTSVATSAGGSARCPSRPPPSRTPSPTTARRTTVRSRARSPRRPEPCPQVSAPRGGP